MSVINTNVNAIIAQNAGVKNSRMQTSAMQQLSTGSRINSAADDAAGLAISSKMTSQIRGLNQAVRNANDGISLIQTAEGALTEVTNMLQRMRELAVQSASDTNTSSDRTALNAEFTSLRDEINRIGNNTQFNGMNVLDHSFNGGNGLGKFVFQVGSNGGQTIDITLGDYRTATSSTSAVAVTTANSDVFQHNIYTAGALAAGNVITMTKTDSVTGVQTQVMYTAAAAMTAGQVADALTTAAVTSLGLTADTGTALDATTTFTGTTAGQTYTLDIKLGTTAVGSFAAATYDAATQTDTLTFSDLQAGDVFSINTGGSTYEYTNSSGSTMSSTAAAAAVYADPAFTTWLTANNLTYADGTANDNSFSLTGVAGTAFTSTVNVNGTGGDLAGINASAIDTQIKSNAAVTALDDAIAVVSGGRATMGATINRLNYAADNLLATSSNVSAARSRVQDTDYSQATTELARTQIIQQASTAMLAQANQSAQSVLSLLK